MPFGMGPAGWFMWPYFTQLYQNWFAGYGFPFPAISEKQEIEFLRQQAKFLEDQLNQIKERIAELEKKG